MKRFEVYRNIRKKALIWGLPVPLFALMMIAVVGSLLVIIFSFSFLMIMSVFFLNACLYTILIRISNKPQLLQIPGVFPGIISNKKSTLLNYEKD